MFLMQEDFDWENGHGVPGNGSVESLQQHALHLAESWGERPAEQIRTPLTNKRDNEDDRGRRKTENAYMNQLEKLAATQGPRASTFVQAAWLAQREMRKTARDKTALIAQVRVGCSSYGVALIVAVLQVVVTVTLNLIIGLVFKVEITGRSCCLAVTIWLLSPSGCCLAVAI